MFFIKYTFDEMAKILKEYGYVLEDYISTTNLVSKDNDGYKFKINLTNLKSGRKPNKFMRNPYALYNLQLYLSYNYPNYILLDDKYAGCKAKMRFICQKHKEKGIQYNTVDNIVHSHHACKYCGCSEVWERKRTPEKQMIEECNRIGIEYVGRISKNNECYVRYICPKHKSVGIQTISWTHIKDVVNGCPHCNKITKGENKIMQYLISNNIEFKREYCFDNCINKRRLKYDFYIPTDNAVIEFNGIQHYSPVQYFGGKEKFEETIFRDKIKSNFCDRNNIDMIIIPYWDYDRIEDILDLKLNKCEKV